MSRPVFAFLAFTSGSYEGAIVRDMRLANALHRRGYKVVVYWMMERNSDLVDEGIKQRLLVSGMRYQFEKPCGVMERLGRMLMVFPPQIRREFMQRHPDYVDRLMTNFCRVICEGGEADRGIVSRLIRFMKKDEVTHLMPTFAMNAPFALAAKARKQHPFEYVVTFQGEEIFANYAKRIDRLDDYHARLREVVDGSPWKSIGISADYVLRLRDEMGIDPEKMKVIYNGIDLPAEKEAPPFEVLRPKFPLLNRDSPIVTYIGRQDSEKGIDLLLYAVKMLEEKGIKLQLVVCGGTSFGQRYRDVIKQMAEHLRMLVHHRRRIPDVMRDALYAYSRCIVYPSIHREPFGLVAVEAMAHGTPVIVPDRGGIAELIEHDGKTAGLTFKAWDSADLARQIERMVTNDALHAELKGNARDIAGRYTLNKMVDEVLEHVGLSTVPGEGGAVARVSRAERI